MEEAKMKKVFLILLAMIGGLFLTMSIVIILMIGAVYGGTKDHKYSARDVKKKYTRRVWNPGRRDYGGAAGKTGLHSLAERDRYHEYLARGGRR